MGRAGEARTGDHGAARATRSRGGAPARPGRPGPARPPRRGPGGRPVRLRRLPATPRTRPAGDRGQVTVEFAGMLPLILLVLVLLWQFVLVGYTFSLAAHAADRGARAAVALRDGGPGACRTAATGELPASWRSAATTTCAADAGLWHATVRLKVPVLFPGAAAFPWTVSGTAGAVDEEGR
ncbi:TadE/TadG family type IV pilus assembly protein [Streptomyces catenulae]|uniref:TadE/TadG family type IV pilus assembly protein n=1 Tax=Streptomyces catenulae TaxID=66875 RepID=A0ABV2YTM1_9ACTN|nr:TadE/TadG family type IV pilus assembly protein [Streptomyces catenulae]